MKNREKYIDEIITMAVNGTCCRFMLDKVMPKFIDNNVNVDTLCEDGKCCECSMLFALWLDEEYEEPPKPKVDWGKVPVDTLVKVRDNDSGKWTLRYFRSFGKIYSSYPPGYDYEVWISGATSVTAEGCTERWRYCELVEDEDDK